MRKKLLIAASLLGVLLLVVLKLNERRPTPPLTQVLNQVLPVHQRLLTAAEEEQLGQGISRSLGIKAGFNLDGNRLNNQWGLMGLEQYLPRFAGDSVSDRAFVRVGMAPGRGAFGYIASSEQEKYYVAVQTLYLPDWNTKARTLKDWYKFRKVLVINPATAAAVVAVIGDAGPAKFTNRQFGGSPQVMHDLGFYPKTHEGRVLLLFVDDPGNKIPLGPIAN